MVNQKILFYYFSLSSHFFIWFSLSLLRISLSLSLSPPSSQPILPLLTIGREQEEGGAEEGSGGGQSSSSSITTTSTNHNHHLNNKTQIQKNPTNPPRHHHILAHNHQNPPLHWNPPLHQNPQPPPLQIKLSPQIHYLRPQPQTKTINHRRLTLCGDHRQPPRRPSPTIANHRLQECRYGVRLGGDGFSWW